jgi:diaminohydroxyphosphoribosylaminopyrimidine deaminase/5-amino-6-(5-phosphoribosylamino)uracil reductase
MKEDDEKYMRQALNLAQRGVGSVEPNPTVGCVIVKGGQVAGSGWHKKFGGPHAEINALADCKNLGIDPKGSTMYVTLEPCCQQGKTPPCTDAIIESKVARVVAATLDPSEHANGAGIEQLESAGIEVQTGVCETEARLLNGPFIKFARTGKCWVTLKWAQSIDGKLGWADNSGRQGWISNEHSRKDVQKLRRRAQGIVVGINTVLADDPLLTVRPPAGKDLIRIVLDTGLRIPSDCRLLSTTKKTPVLILTSQNTIDAQPETAEALVAKGAELLVFPDTPGRSNLHFLIDRLSERGLTRLLVEGGPTVIGSFLKEGLADELCVYISPKILGGRGKDDIALPLAELSEAVEMQYTDVEHFDGDVRIRGLSQRALRDISLIEGSAPVGADRPTGY